MRSAQSLFQYDERDGGTGGGFHAGAEEEAGVGRLIVGDVLPGDGEAILRVMHERVEAMLGGDRRGENAELLVVGGAENDFFAPVAEEVDAESGVEPLPRGSPKTAGSTR